MATLRIEALPADPGPDDVYSAFVEWVSAQGMDLYPAQDEAFVELVSGNHVILSTPTGSGKSLVAAGAQFDAFARGIRTCYTAPIKALVSEKFFALCDTFGAEHVGMLTGDASVNPDAPIICATAEVLANVALREGADTDFGQVVMDEFHYYADPQRGWAWQVPLLEMPQAQFLLMSATLGDVGFFLTDLRIRTGREATLVSSADRPVPLVYSYVTVALHETLLELLSTHQAPVYVVHFTQAAAVEQAQALMSINVCTKAEKQAIAAEIGAFRFTSGFGRTLSRLVRHGIGVHHAGMLPRYRRLVERLAQRGLLKVVCGTDTLGVGINVPIRTVVITALAKYDGRRMRHLKAREFHQVAGRAGRAGFDTSGAVVVQAPEYAIENERSLRKAGEDPKKRRKVVRKKPPEGFVNWTQQTFERLVAAEPEQLRSSFHVTHSMVLNLLLRPDDPVAAVRRLMLHNHDPLPHRLDHLFAAMSTIRALLRAGVIEAVPRGAGESGGLRVVVDLQRDFALNQPLSPFALAALELLDPAQPEYAMDVVSVIEATLEDPVPVIRAQRTMARDAAITEMKAAGIEYEERMELLADIQHPQPLAEELFAAFSSYRSGHPWVADYQLRPKSVARELLEQAMTFNEYVSRYSLARSEGLLLRYLSDAFKALRQTVPEAARTPRLEEVNGWLGELVRLVDSSLLDEWERLTDPEQDPTTTPVIRDAIDTQALVTSTPAFRAAVRNVLFRRVWLASRREWSELGSMDADAGFPADRWRAAMADYFEHHDEVLTGPDARGPELFQIDEAPPDAPGTWRVRQVLDDPAGHRDWAILAVVDLKASEATGEPVVTVTAVGDGGADQ